MKQYAILKDKGKGNHGGTNPIVKENILLLTEKRLSKYTNDVPFLTKLDVPQTVEQLTKASAVETSPLVYYTSAENFPVGNKFYPATPKTVTLAVGDATFGRVDLILANKPDTVGGMGYITKSQGTPSLNYTPNNIDLTTQYIIKWVYVAPNATVGVDITPPPLSATPTLQQVVDEGGTVSNETYSLDISDPSVIKFIKEGVGIVAIFPNNYEMPPMSMFNGLVFRTPNKSGVLSVDNLQKQVTANYTISIADNNYTIFLNSATPITITINNIAEYVVNGNVIDNFSCDFYNLGVGAVTFVNGTATVGYPDGTILNKDKVCSLIRFMATTTYKLKGELV